MKRREGKGRRRCEEKEREGDDVMRREREGKEKM